MKRFVRNIVTVGLLAAAGTARAAAGGGNCQSVAGGATLGVNNVTLVREWDQDIGEWTDGGDTSLKFGVRWFKVDLTVGKNYVVWVEDSSADGIDFELTPYDPLATRSAVSEFATYDHPTKGVSYFYIRNAFDPDEWGYWSPDDKDLTTAPYFFHFYGTTGQSCKFYLMEQPISSYAPSGSALNPISINLASPGSTDVIDVGEDDGTCSFTANLSADTWYVLSSAGEIQDPPDFRLNDWDDPTVTNETISAFDPLSGESIFKVRSNRANTMLLKVMPTESGSCRLSWRSPEVGRIGLKPTAVSVRDDEGVAQVTVSRSSFDMNVCVKWTTVAETARAGYDYAPHSGYLYFEADDVLSIPVAIPLVPGLPVENGVRKFAVRLQNLTADELAALEAETGEKWYSPAPDPKVAQVSILPTGTSGPVPEIPEPQQESDATPLARGSFEGVLTGLRSGVCELTADADGNLSGKLTVDGVVAPFSGAAGAGEVKGTTTIGGETFDFYLNVRLPEGTVGGLATAPGDPAHVSGSVCLSVDGQVEEVFLSGNLYRVESRLDGPTLARMKRKAGRYTVALAGDAQPGDPEGYGHLTVDVAGDGAVTAWGRLADGTSVASNDFSAVANDVVDGLAIPILWRSGTASIAGTLVIGAETPSLVWCDSRRIFGPDGVSSLRMTLTATGGKYDYWTASDRLYNGWSLTVNDRASVFNGLEVTVAEGRFVANQDVQLSVDRASGILTGRLNGHSFSAVLLTSAFAQGAVGAAGFSLDGDGVSSPLEFQLNWLDPDWSENVDSDISVRVSFAANGGTGTPPDAIVSVLGEGIRLPTCTLTRDARYRFVGWLNPLTGDLGAPGDDIETPPEDVVFSAQWEDLEIQKALDSDLSFFPLAEKDWTIVTDAAKAAKGESFVRATASSPAVSEIRTTTDSAGTLSFWWSLVRRDDYSRGKLPDSFALYVDGVKQAELSAIDQGEFVKCEYTIIQPGSHEIRWVYDHSAGQVILRNSGSAALDGVEWEAYDPSMVQVLFDPGEGAGVTFSSLYRRPGAEIGRLPVATRPFFECTGWTNALGEAVTAKTMVPEAGLKLFASWQPAPISVTFDGNGATSGVPGPIPGCRSGDTVTLPAGEPFRSADYVFAGWRWNGSVYQAGAQVGPLLGDTTFVAEWTNVRYQRALKTDLTVEASGWDLAEDVAGSTEGVCLKSTVTGALKATATATVTVSGSGAVSFRWALEMSSIIVGQPSDRLEFFVDGEATPHSLTAKTAWSEVVDVEIEGEGTHELRWVYTATDCMNLAFVQGWGFGLLDWVEWTPAGPQVTVTFDPFGGTVDPTSVRVPTNGFLTTLPTPVCEGKGFVGWRDPAGDQVTAPYQVGEEDVTLTAEWGALPVTVSFAAGGGEGTLPDPVDVVPYSEWYLPSNELSKAHHVFGGWTDGAGVYPAGARYDNVETAMTFTATWTFVACRVTFDANGGECPTAEKICDRGATFGDLPTASRDGFDFGGWTNAWGEAVTPESTVPDVAATTLFAKWDALPISVTFNGNGATRDVPDPITGCRSGDTVTLPAGEPFRSADYVFAGWRWNENVYQPGDQVGPLFGDTTFVAEWTNVRYQRALKTDLPVEASGWDLAEDVAGSTGGVCLKSTVAGTLKATATATVTVNGPGAVSFRWALEMSSLLSGQPTDRLDFFVDGEATPRLSLKGKTTWSEVADIEIEGEGTHELRWVYTATTATVSSFVRAWGRGLLDWVKWASADYLVVVTWGAHILGATYAIEGGAHGEVTSSGASVVVPAGKSVEIVGRADSNNWYYVSSGGGRFTAAGATEIVAALRDATALPSDIRPQDVGLSTAAGAPFATADVNEIAKVIGWARANGKTVSDMNALSFSEGASGDPQDLASTAYLLNCAPTDGAVAEARAAFRFTSFDPADPPPAADFADRGYNGEVKILKATTLTDGGDWSEGDSEDVRFYKAKLVK